MIVVPHHSGFPVGKTAVHDVGGGKHLCPVGDGDGQGVPETDAIGPPALAGAQHTARKPDAQTFDSRLLAL